MDDLDRQVPDLLTITQAVELISGYFGLSRSTLYALGIADALRARGYNSAEVRKSSGGRGPGRFRIPVAAVDHLIREIEEGRPPIPST